MTARELLSEYENRLRGRTPSDQPWEPLGVLTERDGPVARIHYGTHGVVVHQPLQGENLGSLVRRQQEAFAARVEPVEWKVYSHDPDARQLAEALSAAGFTPSPSRALLLADVADVPRRTAPSVRSHFAIFDEPRRRSLRRLAAAAPEQRGRLSETETDTGPWDVLVLERHGRPLDALWYQEAVGAEFFEIDGMTGPRPELLHAAAERAALRSRFIVAEAPDAFVPVHVAAGFHEAARVTTYRWAPPGEPARERPAGWIPEPEREDIWERFEKHFEVTYETAYDGIAEPPGSVTWYMAAVEDSRDPLLAEVEAVVARGLRACGRPGDRLYRLKWYISSTRCDPTRVGGPGQPRWVGYSYLTDENVIQVTADLRMGTYGNFVEESLCVFGADLVAEVEDELTALLGTVLRRDGRPVGNVWTFGP